MPSYYDIFWWCIFGLILLNIGIAIWTYFNPVNPNPVNPIVLIQNGLKIKLRNSGTNGYLGLCSNDPNHTEVISNASSSDATAVWQITTPDIQYAGPFALALQNVSTGLYLFAYYLDGQCGVASLFVKVLDGNGDWFQIDSTSIQGTFQNSTLSETIWWTYNEIQKNPLQLQFVDKAQQSTTIAASSVNDSFCQSRACQIDDLTTSNSIWFVELV